MFVVSFDNNKSYHLSRDRKFYFIRFPSTRARSNIYSKPSEVTFLFISVQRGSNILSKSKLMYRRLLVFQKAYKVGVRCGYHISSENIFLF